MEARNTLTAELGDKTGYWVQLLPFCRYVVIALIDNLVPDYENPHEARKVEDITEDAPTDMPDHLAEVHPVHPSIQLS